MPRTKLDRLAQTLGAIAIAPDSFSFPPVEPDPQEVAIAVTGLQTEAIVTRELDDRFAAIAIVEDEFRLALHWWVRKKFDPRHKIPGKRKQNKAAEPFGELLASTWELCVQLHARQFGQPYPNAATWFRYVLGEFKQNSIALTIHNFDGQMAVRAIAQKSRENSIDVLRRGENPVDPQLSPHYHRLIEAALTQRDRDPKFNSLYWREYHREAKMPHGRTYLSALAAYLKHAGESGTIAPVRHDGNGRYTIGTQKRKKEAVFVLKKK